MLFKNKNVTQIKRCLFFDTRTHLHTCLLLLSKTTRHDNASLLTNVNRSLIIDFKHSFPYLISTP